MYLANKIMMFRWVWTLVTTSSTVTNPFILISGDRQEDMKATGPAIIIGMKTNIHFQSLLSVGQDLPLRYPEIPSNPITLTLEHLGEWHVFIFIILTRSVSVWFQVSDLVITKSPAGFDNLNIEVWPDSISAVRRESTTLWRLWRGQLTWRRKISP